MCYWDRLVLRLLCQVRASVLCSACKSFRVDPISLLLLCTSHTSTKARGWRSPLYCGLPLCSYSHLNAMLSWLSVLWGGVDPLSSTVTVRRGGAEGIGQGCLQFMARHFEGLLECYVNAANLIHQCSTRHSCFSCRWTYIFWRISSFN